MKKRHETLLLLLLILAVSLVVLVIVYQNQRSEVQVEPQSIQVAKTRHTLTPEEEAQKIAKQDMYDFKTRFYKRYPQFQKEVDLKTISHIFSFKTNVVTETDRSGVGWVIGIKNSEKSDNYYYYLLIPGVEKKMDDLFGIYAADVNCSIGKVNSLRFRNATIGPIIISGGCSGYGFHQEFVAVYKFNGEKVRMYENQSVGNIVSSTGNALGKFSKVYGADASVILIEYDNMSDFMMASNIGVFDLKTGELKYFVH